MNAKPALSVNKKLEELINFIENNDLEKVKQIVTLLPSILKQKRYDDKRPIFYAIKYKCNKILEFILQNSRNINYNVIYL